MLHLKSQYSILKYSVGTKCINFCHVAWITCVASAEKIIHICILMYFLYCGGQKWLKNARVLLKGALFTPFLVCLVGLCDCFCVKLVDRQITVLHIWPGQDEVTSNSCVHCLIDFHTTNFYVEQTSINVACMGPDRCWVIEYSWLSEGTYTDLSSYR